MFHIDREIQFAKLVDDFTNLHNNIIYVFVPSKNMYCLKNIL